jgi:peroxiredoxin
MPKNLRANIELGLQVVIAIAVVVVASVVVMRYLSPQQVNPGKSEPQITAGTRLTVPNVDWQQNKKTLVFFLKKDCVYCKYGAPFYRELIEEASKRSVKWLAILPEPVEEGTEYVRSLDLSIENVQSAPLSSYKVSSTPTVLFVDSQGIVKSVWTGSDPTREKQMRAELIALFDRDATNEAPPAE